MAIQLDTDTGCAQVRGLVADFTRGLKAAKEHEVLVFFYKMEGDYERYGAEISTADVRESYKDRALKAYEEAEVEAEKLDKTNPVRLGLALNQSVFFYEICEKKELASKKVPTTHDLSLLGSMAEQSLLRQAKAAFDDAIMELDKLSGVRYQVNPALLYRAVTNSALVCPGFDGHHATATRQPYVMGQWWKR